MSTRPPSPPRFGYVAGVEDKGEMHGYVGGKPATREEGGRPQARRQAPNLASPDLALANSAFTQSQFTSAATIQSFSANGAGSGTDNAPTREDVRRANLRKYTDSTKGSGTRNNVCTPHPNFSQQTRTINNRAGTQQQLSNVESLSESTTPTQSAAVFTPPTAVLTQPTYIGFTFSDPGFMYKSFTGTTSWIRVAQLIQPEGKRATKVYASTMIVATAGGGVGDDEYSLRLVDTSVTPAKTLWADYGCNNSQNFKVFVMDATNASAGGLLEIQAQNATGQTILISTVIVEF